MTLSLTRPQLLAGLGVAVGERIQGTVGVRHGDQTYRVTDAYYDHGDGYWVIEIEDRSVQEQLADNQPKGRFGTDDVNDKWQMYTPEGNAAMEQAFQNLARWLREGKVNWITLEQYYTQVMAEVGKTHPECDDTEPRCQMKDELDKVLDELGYKPLEF